MPAPGEDGVQSISKPEELLALHDITAELFTTLKNWFDVADEVTISLADIDSAVEELGEPVLIAAMAMRKLQALRLLAQPGVRTTTDVVVTVVQDLDRALLQAPAMWLKRTAATTDWDAEFAALVDEDDAATEGDSPYGASGDASTPAGEGETSPAASPTPGDQDPAVTRFRELHAGLHRALRAVVTASEGEIRILV
ncbi:MAG: hypothetical protein R6U94_07200 [Nitriliruptoraceae bacterium]